MAPVAKGATVAVTGASGFLGSHVCAALLDAGYHVRATVRDPNDTAKVAHLLALPGAKDSGRLSLHRGVLDEPGSYDAAFAGADAVIHTAAVVEINATSDPEAQIVRPSVEGVQNVLASADRASSVRRFVHTSSEIAALKWDEALDSTFDEATWNSASTVQNGDPYGYAKATAEKLVLEHNQASYDCVSILPGVNLGPCMTKAHTKSSAVIVRQFLFGNKQPEYNAHLVDVRDTAVAHVRALSVSLEAGASRRFIVCSDNAMPISMLEEPLKRLFPQYVIAANPHPGPVVKSLMNIPLLWRIFTSEFQRCMCQQEFKLDNAKSKTLLGMQYRTLDETLRDTVASMVDPGFVQARISKGGLPA
eukprot:TRINITY_DN14452_c0_g1_i1.p1 TRINITY_DN14452_c0_g1~~TRINITY_DN14452_c0_g1_i1.p1  ORF type:complete len:362 (+),score=64.04 TRINITY_DN14452_c0_g1_i1:66-1151(+)